MATQNPNDVLKVRIISPENMLFEGLATTLTCMNKEGEFDILAYHSNFISLIYKEIKVKPVEGTIQKFEIGYALLKCYGNEITILTNVDISSYTEIISATRNDTISQGQSK